MKYVSKIEDLILNSQAPIQVESNEVITVNGQQGAWLNKEEELEWTGPVSLNEYGINEDEDPVVIQKSNPEFVDVDQQVTIRYLKPPTPEPGEIIIREEPAVRLPSPPPLIIRQYGARPKTPEPIIYREAPPEPPKDLEPKIITIPARQLDPKPRRVIVEKLPDLPSKPPDIIIEKWLPYPKRKRKVIYERSSDERDHSETRNILIEWDRPSIKIEHGIKDMGVYRTDPCEYMTINDLNTSNNYSVYETESDESDIDVDFLKSLGLDSMLSSTKAPRQFRFKSTITEFTPKDIGHHYAKSKSSSKFENDSIYANINEYGLTVFDLIKNSFNKYKHQNFLCHIENQSEALKWSRYSDVKRDVFEIGSGLISLGLEPGQDSKIGFYLLNRPEYTIFELCCSIYSFISVPIDNGFSIGDISYILKQTEMTVMACDNCDKSIDLMQTKSNLKLIIILDNTISKHAYDRAKSLSIHLITYNRLKEIGQQQIAKPVPSLSSDIHSIVYKINKNESPKGVVLTHANIVSAVGLIDKVIKDKRVYLEYGQEAYFSCLPYSSIFEKVMQLLMINIGGSIISQRIDFRRFSKEILHLNPTVIGLTKTYAERFYNKLNEFGVSQTEDIFGTRSKLVLIQNFLSDAKILEMFKKNSGCEIMEINGEPETCGISNIRSKNSFEIEKICSSYKLVDVPMIGLVVNRDHQGEILIKGGNIFHEYYDEHQSTKSVFDENGFYRTGDLGHMSSEGRVKFVDTLSETVKIRSGQYVSTKKLESIYLKSSLVSQIFVFGTEMKNSLIGIVVPNEENIQALANKHNLEFDMTRLCRNPMFKQIILSEMNQVANDHNLENYEKISDIYLHPEKFTTENKLLGFDSKLNKNELKYRFIIEIDQMYSKLD